MTPYTLEIIMLSGTPESGCMMWEVPPAIGVARGTKGPIPPQVLEHIVILCFERRFSKQNSVIRLKTNILPSPKFPSLPPNYWVGYATAPCPFTRGKGDGGAFKSIIGNFRICQDGTETNLLQLFVHQKVHNGFL